MFAALALLVMGLDDVLDAPELKGAVVSATVMDLGGNVSFERNTDLRVMPASNQKLISCAFALHELGSDYIPKTRIWKLKDRVVVESNGDPSLAYDQLAQAKKALKLTGKLPVYVKQAYRVGIPDSWEIDDLPNRYAAPVSAFCFDQAAFELWAERGRAFLLPASFGVRIQRDLTLKPGSSRYDPLKRLIKVGANLSAKRTRLDTLALPSADECAAMVLGHRFFTTKTVPTRAPDLTIQGKPLKEILKTCLVNSDNIMAENLLLMASAHQGEISDKPYEKARERVTKFLKETVQVDDEDLRIYDGSGMSRHNLVTSRAIARLLAWAAKQPTADLWKSCLVSPKNGTLKGRLADVEFRGKTGTLDMVVSLSGYVETKNGEEKIMSVILNHFTASSAKAREIVDRFAKLLGEENDGTPVALCYQYEARRSDPRTPSSDGNWPCRFDRNGRPSRPGQDRRGQSSDARPDRAERAALRGR